MLAYKATVVHNSTAMIISPLHHLNYTYCLKRQACNSKCTEFTDKVMLFYISVQDTCLLVKLFNCKFTLTTADRANTYSNP